MKNNRLIYLFVIILTIWCVGLTVLFNSNTDNHEQIINETEVTGFSTDFTKVVDEHKDSIVTVYANGTISSGFVYKQVDNSVYILTCYHSISESSGYNVFFANNFSKNAELVGLNIYEDVAVLKVESPYQISSIDLADSSLLKAGEFLISIGTPVSNEYSGSVELGMVSSPRRTISNNITFNDENIEYYIDTIQLSSNLKQGYSGSPVINMNGEVVGIVTMSLDSRFNFAIPSNELKILADGIINDGSCKKYRLGLKGTYITEMPMFERSSLNLPVDIVDGLYIDGVMNSSLAHTIGIKQGDVVTNINGVALKTFDDYLNIMYSKLESIDITIYRDGQYLNYKVEVND